MRKPKLSGVYYKASNVLLEKQIKEAFTHELGPGDLPLSDNSEDVQGIIVPHYGYDFAAPCMAWGYKSLAEAKFPDVFIIVAESDESGITTEPYETPFGFARIEQKLAKSVLKKGNIKENNPLFDRDDFVESQLPFLQFIHGRESSVKILPILLNGDINLRSLCVDIKESLADLDLSAKIIVPSNLTKFGPDYTYLPFSSEVSQKVYDLDHGAFEAIRIGNAKGYLDYYSSKGMNSDNPLGIAFALQYLRPKNSLLEQYYTTADINDDLKNFVTFASVILK